MIEMNDLTITSNLWIKLSCAGLAILINDGPWAPGWINYRDNFEC
jgi:hypothetical protein